MDLDEQLVLPREAAYVPPSHVVQIAPVDPVWLPGPNFPATHGVPMHTTALGASVYVPEGQSVQDAPSSVLNLPGTHVLLQICASSAALPRNSPGGHVLSVHGELSVFTEYLPLPQGAQEVSLITVPASAPVPVSHDGLECVLHASVPSLLEKNPVLHGTQDESSSVAVPSMYLLPALHVRTDLGLQSVVSSALLYVPAAHDTQAESSSDVVPST